MENTFIVQSIGPRKRTKRTLEIGNTLRRRRKGYSNGPKYPWAIVRDVITAAAAADTSEYVAALCEGVEEYAGKWYAARSDLRCAATGCSRTIH